MARHSKWHQIRRKKEIIDMKRGKVLTKHAKIIMVVGRTNHNPETNVVLRNAIANAKADGVPKENIEKILKKLAGEGKNGVVYQEVLYEGFAPGGIPVIVQTLTDNVNRTFPEVRTAFVKNGGNLGNTGSVGFLFDHWGIVFVKTNGKSEEELLNIALEAGAGDMVYDEAETEILTDFKSLGAVRLALEGKVEIIKTEGQYRSKESREIIDPAEIEALETFLEAVEGVEDVDEVFLGGHIVAGEED